MDVSGQFDEANSLGYILRGGSISSAISNIQILNDACSRPECEQQVKGFPGAVHKKFKTSREALEWLGPIHNIPSPGATQPGISHSTGRQNAPRIAGDNTGSVDPRNDDEQARTDQPSAKRQRIDRLADESVGDVTVNQQHSPLAEDHLTVYTDGSCRGNGQVGSRAGSGVFWGDGAEERRRRGFPPQRCAAPEDSG